MKVVALVLLLALAGCGVRDEADAVMDAGFLRPPEKGRSSVYYREYDREMQKTLSEHPNLQRPAQ